MGKTSSLAEILTAAQRSAASHRKCISQLESLSSQDESVLSSQLLVALRPAFCQFKHEAVVDRLFSFVRAFAGATKHKISTNNNKSFALHMIEQLMPLTDARAKGKQLTEMAKGVRLRSCQLIAELLAALPDDEEIEPKVWAELERRLKERTLDKVPQIRAAAVQALALLQVDDRVINHIKKLMVTDPSKDVRKVAVSHLCLTDDTKSEIITRSRDIIAEVRCAAFQRATRNCDIRHLTVPQRVQLVGDGLRDREPSVRKACLELLKKWLENESKDDLSDTDLLCQFLSLFGVERQGAEPQVALIANELILLRPGFQVPETFPAGNSDATAKDYTSEIALLWRVTAEKLKKDSKDIELDEIMPELRDFCEYIKYLTENRKTFALKQILLLLDLSDLADEVGRRHLSSLLREIVGVAQPTDDDNELAAGSEVKVIPIILDHELATLVVHQMRRATPDAADFVRQINELKADLQDHLQIDDDLRQRLLDEEKQLQHKESLRSEIQKKIRGEKNSELRDKMEQKLDEMEAEIDTLKDRDQSRMFINKWISERCLVLIESLLQSSGEGLMSDNEINNLRNWTAEVGLGHLDSGVRARAMRCVGLLYLLSGSIMRNQLLPFVIAVRNDEFPVRLAALKAIFDSVTRSGKSLLLQSDSDDTPGDEDDPKTRLPKNLLSFLKASIKFRVAAADADSSARQDSDEESDREEGSGEETDWIDSIIDPSLEDLPDEVSQFLADAFQVGVEGFCKMLLADVCTDARVLTDLFTLLFDPSISGHSSSSAIHANDAAVVQCLNQFFPRYASASRAHQLLLTEAFAATIRRFCYAGKYSPLQQAAVDKLVPYFVELTSPTNLRPDARQLPVSTVDSLLSTSHSHNALAMRMVEEMTSNPAGKETKLIAKSLVELNLSKSDARSFKVLQIMVSELMQRLPEEKTLKKQIKTFADALVSLDPEPATTLSPEETQVIEDHLGALTNEKDKFKMFMERYSRDEDVRFEKQQRKRRELDLAIQSDDEDDAEDEDESDSDSSDSDEEVPAEAPSKPSSRPARGAAQGAQQKIKENKKAGKQVSKILKKMEEDHDSGSESEDEKSSDESSPKKRKREANDSESSDSEDDKSEVVIVPKPVVAKVASGKRTGKAAASAKPVQAKRAAAKNTARLRDVVESESESSESDSDKSEEVPAPKPKRAAAKRTSAKADVVDSPSESEDEPAAKLAKRTVAKRASAKAVPVDSSSESEEEPAAKPAKRTAKRSAAKRAARKVESDSSESENEPAPKQSAAKKASAKRTAPVRESESESDSIESDSDRSAHIPAPKSPPIARRLSTGSRGISSPLAASRTLAESMPSDDSDESGPEELPAPSKLRSPPPKDKSDDDSISDSSDDVSEVIAASAAKKVAAPTAPAKRGIAPPAALLKTSAKRPTPVPVAAKSSASQKPASTSGPKPVAPLPAAKKTSTVASTLLKPTASSVAASKATANPKLAAPVVKQTLPARPTSATSAPKPVAPRPIAPTSTAAAAKKKPAMPPKTPNTKRREDIMKSAISLLEDE